MPAKTWEGIVIRARTPQTVVVEVSTTRRHAVYGKIVAKRKRYLVHDEMNVKVGDRVRIRESLPISRRKRFTVSGLVEENL